VADSGNNRIERLFNARRKVEWVGSYTGKSGSDKGLSGPMQVALDEDCRIYVTDTKNSRIVVFDTTGSVVRKIGPGGTTPFIDGPTTLAVGDGKSRWSYHRKERLVFCADKGGTRLWKLDVTGRVLKVFNMPKGHRAYYGATDYYHNLWVTDVGKHCVLKFDHDLKLLDIFGSEGTGDNQFDEPRGIAIWKRYGQTFIAERKGAQYYWVGTQCNSRSLACNADAGSGGRSIVGKPRPCALDLYVTEYSYVSLFRVEQEDTLYYMKRRMARAGQSTLAFGPGKRDPLVVGKEVILRVEPTYSSYTYYRWDFPMSVEAR
jgi:sugar lactone lactonase YvrE